MAPPGFKITAVAVFVYVLALIHIPSAAAVDIGGFTALRSCSAGMAIACLDIGERVCCQMFPGVHSVSFKGLDDRTWGNVYDVNNCGNPVLFSRKGPRSFCYGHEEGIRSARFFENYPRRPLTNEDNGELVESDEARGCNSTMLPNAVVYYTSDETWVLKSNNDKVETVLKHVESLPEDQQLAWMKNAGAELTPSMGKMDMYGAGVGTQ